MTQLQIMRMEHNGHIRKSGSKGEKDSFSGVIGPKDRQTRRQKSMFLWHQELKEYWDSLRECNEERYARINT